MGRYFVFLWFVDWLQKKGDHWPIRLSGRTHGRDPEWSPLPTFNTKQATLVWRRKHGQLICSHWVTMKNPQEHSEIGRWQKQMEGRKLRPLVHAQVGSEESVCRLRQKCWLFSVCELSRLPRIGRIREIFLFYIWIHLKSDVRGELSLSSGEGWNVWCLLVTMG